MFGKNVFYFFQMEYGQECRPSQCIFEKSEYLHTGRHIYTAYLAYNMTIHFSKCVLKNKNIQETTRFFFIEN